MTIRILLADDQALLRATFRILIDSCEDMEVVAEAADGAAAVDLARAHRPDVILMDIRMPGTDGLAATSAICADPELSDTRVLILTTFEIDEYVAQALRSGASGFLGKDVTAEALLGGIRTVAAGDSLLSPRRHPHPDHPLPRGPGARHPPRGRGRPDRSHHPGARGDGVGRRGALQRGDRREALRQPPDRAYPRPPRDDQAGRP
ncbi:DNA-binding NarL/FixJ family response regulator [Streptomyces sp. SAI-135]|nr:DNA-binding NarL/FixJ family response regulator [Streptomyces sp. SAI-135]